MPYGFLFGLLRSRVSRRRGRRAAAPDGRGAPTAPACASCSRRRSATARCRSSTGSRTAAAGSTPPARPVELPAEDDEARRTASSATAARGRDRARPRAVRRPGAGALGRGRRRAGDRERAPAGRAARARRGAAALARPDRRGRHGRAPPARAQPARRRPAAARRALADAAARAGQADKDPDGRGAARRRAGGAGRALEELRELARGIHPAVLSDRGLGPALEALAGRSPCRSSSRATPPERLPAAGRGRRLLRRRRGADQRGQVRERVAGARRVSRSNGHAVVEVADDGVGGADPGRGSGLRGLADRVAALDGRSRSLRSPEGAGTLLRAEIPV